MSIADFNSVLGAVGGIGGISTLLIGVRTFLKKNAEKKENRERVANALRALNQLDDLLTKNNEIGKSLKELVEVADIPLAVMQNEKVYQIIGEMFDNITKIYEAFSELSREAKVISGLSFMEDLSKSDRQAADIVKFLANCVHDGKLDLKDLPTMISIYGPRGWQARKSKEYSQAQVDKARTTISKAKKISQSLGPPKFRTTKNQVRRSLVGLAAQRSKLEKMDNDLIDQLYYDSPDWMAPLVDLIGEAREHLDSTYSRQSRR